MLSSVLNVIKHQPVIFRFLETIASKLKLMMLRFLFLKVYKHTKIRYSNCVPALHGGVLFA